MISEVVDMQIATRIPICDPGHVLERITFESCPGSSLEIRCCKVYPTPRDDAGVHEDSWWMIVCSNLPNRSLRLTRGRHSLYHLIKRYGFLDDKECMNHRRCRFHYATEIRSKKLKSSNTYETAPEFLNSTSIRGFVGSRRSAGLLSQMIR